MKNKLKYLFLSIIAVFVMVPNHPVFAFLGDLMTLGGISGGVVGGAMDSAFSKLGVDQDELKIQHKNSKCIQKEKQQPQVEVYFNPSNPISGQKVTATAVPTYFLNEAENLYFTWYLKPSGCPEQKDNNPSDDKKEDCDFDKDGDVDIEDYKVKAMRAIVNGGFEWDGDGNGVPNSSIYENDTDGDGYTAIWGGDDQGGKNNHCFIHDVSSGDEYEISCSEHHLFPNAKNCSGTCETGDGSFGLEEEKFWHTNPKDQDTSDYGKMDEAVISGLGITSFTWNYQKGDKIGVAIEGISTEPTQNDDSSFKIMWAFVKNKCDLGSKSIKDAMFKTTSVEGTPENIGTGETCPYGTKKEGAIIQKRTDSYTEKNEVNHVNNMYVIREHYYKRDITDTNCNGLFDEDAGSPYDDRYTCPNGLNEDDTSIGYNCVGADKVQFFNLDELSIKRGQVFKSGEATDEDLNGCLYDNYLDPAEGGGTSTKMDISLSYSPEFPMNDSISSVYDSSNNPLYDKNGDGDLLTVQSSITNADNPGYLKYDWQLYESNDPNPESWKSIEKERLPDDLKKSGMGLDSLRFRLNIPDLKEYLRVKLTISENATDGSGTRKGNVDVVIPISKVSERIQVFSTSTSVYYSGSEEKYSFSRSGDERCMTNGKADAICKVAKNEIVSLGTNGGNMTDFLWTVNGTAIQNVNSNEVFGKTAYFPILEDNGYAYSVELSATNEKGEKVNIVRTLVVSDPEVEILSADENTCVPNLLGHYIDLDGKYWADYSKSNFSAIADSAIVLQPVFVGKEPAADEYNWIVNGKSIDSSNASTYGYSISSNKNLTLAPKSIGNTYEVTIGYIYTQDAKTKNALNKYWGVQYNEFYEKKVAKSIEIKVLGSISETQGAQKNGPKKILASLYSATPANLIFLLRLSITTFAMILFSKIILSFFPNIKQNEY